jgi:mono/diheme cytochrome c family protein
MRTLSLVVLGIVIGAGALLAGGFVYLRSTGLTTRGEPGAMETTMAGTARRLAMPSAARGRQNPVPDSSEARVEALEHYADHCTACHANDGSGDTEMGRGLFPRAPDMRLPATQDMSDGELFYVIENGIRFTGMPAWGTGTDSGEQASWKLVRFIRHLAKLTPDELEAMKKLNPRSPEEIRLEIEEDRFLNQGAQK